MIVSYPSVLYTPRKYAAAAVACIVAGVFGCDGTAERFAEIEGDVTLDGKPLNGGIIMFTAADGRQGISEIHRDGTYRVGMSPVGELDVTVNTAAIESMAQAAARGAPVGLPKTFKAIPAPARYREKKTSGLKYAANEGPNHIRVELVR